MVLPAEFGVFTAKTRRRNGIYFLVGSNFFDGAGFPLLRTRASSQGFLTAVALAKAVSPVP
jgi:hypothetical protein